MKKLKLYHVHKLKTIIYHVDDIEKARDWYTKITGVTPYFHESYYKRFNIYGCELGLDLDMNNVKKSEHSVAYWSVDNITESIKYLIDNNVTIVNQIPQVGDNIKVAVVEDPFGNHIGLIEGNIVTS